MSIMSMSHKFVSYYKIIDVFSNNLTKYLSAYCMSDIILKFGVKQSSISNHQGAYILVQEDK